MYMWKLIKESIQATIRPFWITMYILTLLLGLLLAFAVGLDLFLFTEEEIFKPFEMSQAVILILLALFIKKYILPRVKKRTREI
jgi:membrane protein YdbS with pleckstrin-like domain